jgi:hypothetical protein
MKLFLLSLGFIFRAFERKTLQNNKKSWKKVFNNKRKCIFALAFEA